MSNQKPQAGDFCWNELMTSDSKKAAEFYGALFGWKAQEQNVGNATYTMFKNGDKDIAGMMQIPQDEQQYLPSHWMAYVCVEDVEAMTKKAQTFGARIIVPITQAGDYGLLAVIEDPTGAHISMWQPFKDS